MGSSRIVRSVGVGVVVAAAALAGCAAGEAVPPASSREDLCVRLLRDLRLYCRTGLSDERATTGFDCLNTRMEFERACL